MLNKLKIGTKLYLGFGILILMLSSIVLTGWFGVGQVNYGLKVVQYFGAVSDNGNQSIINCEQAKTALALMEKQRHERDKAFMQKYRDTGVILGEILKAVDAPYKEQVMAPAVEGNVPLLYFKMNKVARDCRGALTAFKIAYDAYQLAIGEEEGRKTHKGFAVVAEEVRNLAARSAKAAAETTQMIGNNNTQIQAGADVASQTADTLVAIVEQATQVADLIGKIATANQEQASAITSRTGRKIPIEKLAALPCNALFG